MVFGYCCFLLFLFIWFVWFDDCCVGDYGCCRLCWMFVVWLLLVFDLDLCCCLVWWCL